MPLKMPPALAAGTTALALLTSISAFPAYSQNTSIAFIIGGGWVTGAYYPVAGAVCQRFEAVQPDGERCAIAPSHGSIENIEDLRSGGELMGMAQSDWVFHAYHGTSIFEEAGAFEDLRSIAALQAEPVTVMVRADLGVDSFEGLKGRKINIGEPGSGTRATWDVIADALDWSEEDQAAATEYGATEAFVSFCSGNIDAFFWLVGQPSELTNEAIRSCGAKLLSVEGEEIDELIEDNSYFRKTVIPAGTYPGQESDIVSFGVGAVLVTRADAPESLIHDLVSAIAGDIDAFAAYHPTLQGLTPQTMAGDGLSAPLHPGAERAYEELGVKW